MMSEAQINKKFLTCENPTLGFRMMYPSGSKIIEENPGRVIFISSQNTEIRIIINNVSKSIDINKLPLRNITAHNDALNEIKALRSVASHIRDNEVMVGASHISDWRVDYNVLGHYIIDTNLVTSGKRFTISYVEATSGNKDIINNAGNAQFISNNKNEKLSNVRDPIFFSIIEIQCIFYISIKKLTNLN